MDLYNFSKYCNCNNYLGAVLCFRSCLEIRNCRLDGLELDAFAFCNMCKLGTLTGHWTWTGHDCFAYFWRLVALLAVGRMKLLTDRVLLELRCCWLLGLPPILASCCWFIAFFTSTTLRAALIRDWVCGWDCDWDCDWDWFSLKLVLPLIFVRGAVLVILLRTRITLGPTLDPLLLLLLAGTPRPGVGRIFWAASGLLLGEESTDTVAPARCTAGRRLTTVCVEAPLLIEEREERRLFLELLRSTPARTCCSCGERLTAEAERRGAALASGWPLGMRSGLLAERLLFTVAV